MNDENKTKAQLIEELNELRQQVKNVENVETVRKNSGRSENRSSEDSHYLKEELYRLVHEDPAIFDFLQDGSLDGIWYWDIEKPEHEWMSPRFWEVFGYNPIEKPHLAEAWQDMIHPDDLELAIENFQKHCQDPKHRYDQVVRYRHRNGSTVWVRCRGIAIRDSQGKPVRMLGAHTEVTVLKETEEALRQAGEEAELANRTKSEFLASMSHELRTPLNAVIGYSEMLQEEARDLGQEDFVPDLKKIHDAGRHLLTMINDVLDMSKIEAGKMELTLGSFDISELIDSVVNTIQPLARDNGNDLVEHGTDSLGDMYADHTRTHECLGNLLSNACKFTKNGTVSLAVRRERVEGREEVVFRVKDTGIGMSTEQLARLFQPFVQADNSTTRKYGGTGLGLAITRQFSRMMGGDVEAESQLGSGSTFTLRLPTEVKDGAGED